MKRVHLRNAIILISVWALPGLQAFGWDEEGHVTVTRLAVESLPTSMPAWIRTPEVRTRLEYLSVEPDRWRGQDNIHLDHINKPDHFIDAELLQPYGLSLETLPRLRREFTDALATQRALHPEKFGRDDRPDDPEYTHDVPGLLPYAIAELQWKVASSWSTLNAYERHRKYVTEDMIRNARENVVFHMGILSHFVGDGSQPLHTTSHFNGWSGENPRGFTTSNKFHSYIDGGVLRRHGIDRDSLKGRALSPAAVSTKAYWRNICAYLERTHDQVVPLYELEKSGDLNKEAGKKFIEQRLLDGGAMLAGVWEAAYNGAVIDDYLERKLTARRRDHAGSNIHALP